MENEQKLNGFNNGRDTTDGVGGKPSIFEESIIPNSIEVDSEIKLEDSPILNVTHLEKSLEESERKYLLLYADFENYKRRVAREKEELVTSTKVKTLTSILDMDNDLNYAIKSIKSDESKAGLELIQNKLSSFLKGQGIEEIQTTTYDEDLHEVISVMEIGESKIIDVISKGYSLNGKPFRYPKVILGK